LKADFAFIHPRRVPGAAPVEPGLGLAVQAWLHSHLQLGVYLHSLLPAHTLPGAGRQAYHLAGIPGETEEGGPRLAYLSSF